MKMSIYISCLKSECEVMFPLVERSVCLDNIIPHYYLQSQDSRSLFEQACNERIQQFDDINNEEEVWQEKEITFDQRQQ